MEAQTLAERHSMMHAFLPFSRARTALFLKRSGKRAWPISSIVTSNRNFAVNYVKNKIGNFLELS